LFVDVTLAVIFQLFSWYRYISSE